MNNLFFVEEVIIPALELFINFDWRILCPYAVIILALCLFVFTIVRGV